MGNRERCTDRSWNSVFIQVGSNLTIIHGDWSRETRKRQRDDTILQYWFYILSANTLAEPNTMLSNLRQQFALSLGVRPSLFSFIMGGRPKFRDVIARSETDIVIEGFPRSANTFAVAAFQYAQRRPLTIARHTHAPAQIMLASRANIPCLVLIKFPL